MKKKYKFRKKFQELAARMGLEDKIYETVQEKPVTKEPFRIAVNNGRRFVKGMLKYPLDRQELKLKQLEERVLMAEADARFKAQQAAEAQKLEVKTDDTNGTGNS